MPVERPTPKTNWFEAGLKYYRQSFHYRNKFGCRVQKISLDGGFTCPNVDGTVTTGGCTFCDNRSFSPSRRAKRVPLTEQFEVGRIRVTKRYGKCKYLAYFQPATNTFAPLEKLKQIYNVPLQYEDVLGIVIGTRPDCVPPDVLDYLEELATKTYVCIEYGMQTMHDASLDWMNRGHHHDCMIDAMNRSRGRGFDISAHLILGLPNESHSMIMESVHEVIRLGFDGVKIHNLYAVERTKLADQVRSGEVQLMERDEYVSLVVDLLEVLPESMVIERLCGDAPTRFFIGPMWSRDKPELQEAIDQEIDRRKTYQSRLSQTLAINH